VAYFDKGQFELARASFLQAYALRKHPAVLLNLGLSSLRSGHTLEAARYLTQFLREHSGASVAQRTDADRGLREARQKLGRVEVAGVPAGTDIFIDDEKVGTTPLDQPADVEPGTHMVRARGRVEDAVQITVNGGQLTTARFGMATPPPAVVPAPAPAPAAPAAPPSDEPPAAPPSDAAPAAETPPEPQSADSNPPTSRRSFWSPPNNAAPVVVGGLFTVAGIATAITFFVFKQNAQNSADSVEATIKANGGTTCTPRANGYSTRFANACSALSTDDDKVNTDALIGNIALGVGLGAAAFTVIYWFAGSRAEAPATTTTGMSRPVVTPILGKGIGGLSIGASF